MNITGPETVSIREVALRLGALLGRKATFTGTEAPTGWINNAGDSFKLFGYPCRESRSDGGVDRRVGGPGWANLG